MMSNLENVNDKTQELLEDDTIKSLVKLSKLYSAEFNKMVKTLTNIINDIIGFLSNVRINEDDNTLVLEIKGSGVVLLIYKDKIEGIRNEDEPP